MKNKKAELTTQQIVMLVILITSFIVILSFIFILDPGDTTEKEICRNSVAMRGSSVLGVVAPPLKCHRSYVCITKDGSCEDMTNPELKEVKTEDDVYEVLAEELAECWWMFGEGKVDYVGSTFSKKIYCSICSQISFDNSLKTIFPTNEIQEKYFYEVYLPNNKYTDDLNYSQYLFGTNDFSKIHKGSFKAINLDNQVFAFMGMTTKKSVLKNVLAFAALGGVVVAAIVAAPITGTAVTLATITGKILVASGIGIGGTGGHYIASTGEGPQGTGIIWPTLIGADSKEFKELDCEDIITLS